MISSEIKNKYILFKDKNCCIQRLEIDMASLTIKNKYGIFNDQQINIASSKIKINLFHTKKINILQTNTKITKIKILFP